MAHTHAASLYTRMSPLEFLVAPVGTMHTMQWALLQHPRELTSFTGQ